VEVKAGRGGGGVRVVDRIDASQLRLTLRPCRAWRAAEACVVRASDPAIALESIDLSNPYNKVGYRSVGSLPREPFDLTCMERRGIRHYGRN
jgi:hypothetical protein